MKPIVSICMMVKDEEANLTRCLESLQPLMQAIASELVIVDTGSTDQTVAIATRYTDRVYHHPWNQNFSEMRNISIRYATGDWVFIIDADEELENVDGVIRLLSSPIDKKIGALALQIKNITDYNSGLHIGALSPRIFRKNREFCYKGVVHNEPVYKGTILDTGNALFHYGYLYADKELMERKFQRTSTLLKKELEKDPKNIYYRYQLAMTYAMHGDQQECLRELEKTYFQCQYDDMVLRKYIFICGGLLQAYVTNSKFGDEVIRIGRHGLRLEPEYADLYYFLGQIYEMRGQYEEAYSYFAKHLDLVNRFSELKIRFNLSIVHYTLDRQGHDHYNMAVMSYKNKNNQQARRHIQEALAVVGNNTNLLQRIEKLVFEVDLSEEQYENCRALYKKIAATHQQEDIQNIEGQLEKHWQQLTSERQRYYSSYFQHVPGIYGFLNSIRLWTGEISRDKWLEQLEILGEAIVDLPVYYAPLVVGLMRQYPQDVWKVSSRLSEQRIVDYMTYMDEISKVLFIEICRDFMTILPVSKVSSYQMARMQKNIGKYLLFSGVLSKDEYKEIFVIYIEKGKLYLETLYSDAVFTQELIYDLKNREELFLLYMILAERSIESGNIQIQYLKKALAVYPEMSKGVEIILQSLAQRDKSKELEELIEKLLDIVEEHIAKGQFNDALTIVFECENIIGKNLRLLEKKSEIYQKQYIN